MEKLEIKLVNNFIIDVANFVKYKDTEETSYREHPMK